MSKNKHCRTCTICKFSKNYNIYGKTCIASMGWILTCTNEDNRHFGKRYYPIVETREIPFEVRRKCCIVDDELKRIADEKDARRKLLKEWNKSSKNQETYGTCEQSFPDNTWLHCLQIGRTLRDMY